MRRSLAWWLLLLFGPGLGVAGACSSGDSSGEPTASAGEGGGRAESGGAGSAGRAGSVAQAGEAQGPQAGGAPGVAGAPQTGGHGDDTNQAGSVADAGAPSAGGAGEPPPLPPDLITSSGGPWPDSFTGTCSSTTRTISCPQRDGAFFGQDGSYRINAPKYTTTSSTVHDSVTGLIWQLKPDSVAKTASAAASYCDALELAGESDWRLPTRLEYVSLLDEGFGAGYALPPSIPLENTGTFWTASASGTTADGFFAIDDSAGLWTVAVADSQLGARCVRGTAPSGTRQIDGDVLTDSMTGLSWQITNLDDTARTWESALSYCEGLSHAGKDDWRLPSIKELATLVDETAVAAPVIAADFGSSSAESYWSSTPAHAPPGAGERFAFALETAFGSSPNLKMTDTAAAARCVRTAN